MLVLTTHIHSFSYATECLLVAIWLTQNCMSVILALKQVWHRWLNQTNFLKWLKLQRDSILCSVCPWDNLLIRASMRPDDCLVYWDATSTAIEVSSPNISQMSCIMSGLVAVIMTAIFSQHFQHYNAAFRCSYNFVLCRNWLVCEISMRPI